VGPVPIGGIGLSGTCGTIVSVAGGKCHSRGVEVSSAVLTELMMSSVNTSWSSFTTSKELSALALSYGMRPASCKDRTKLFW